MEKNVIVTQVKVHHEGRHVKQPNILALKTFADRRLTLPFFETAQRFPLVFNKQQDPNDQQRNTCILQDTVLFHI